MSAPHSARAAVAIRAATAADVILLAALHVDIFARAPTGEVWDQEAIARILALPGAGGLLAIQPASGRPLGLALYRVAADEAEILSIGVARAARRNGAGRALLHAVLTAARGAGARRLFLEVATENQPARDLYSAEGLQVVGRRPRYYRREEQAPVDALIFARSL